MALQSSGRISLNDIHREAGGGSGTRATINDSDIRGLIGKGSGRQMSFSEWYGASSQIWSTTITVGRTNELAGFFIGPVVYGFSSGALTLGSAGSASDATVDFLGANANLVNLYWSGSTILFQVLGVFAGIPGVVAGSTFSYPNSGFNSMTVGGQTFNRTSATYIVSQFGVQYTTWKWSTSTNPFGTTVGAKRTVVFS